MSDSVIISVVGGVVAVINGVLTYLAQRSVKKKAVELRSQSHREHRETGEKLDVLIKNGNGKAEH